MLEWPILMSRFFPLSICRSLASDMQVLVKTDLGIINYLLFRNICIIIFTKHTKKFFFLSFSFQNVLEVQSYDYLPHWHSSRQRGKLCYLLHCHPCKFHPGTVNFLFLYCTTFFPGCHTAWANGWRGYSSRM